MRALPETLHASARGTQLGTRSSGGPQGAPTPRPGLESGVPPGFLQNHQKGELVAARGTDLWSSPSINSNRGNR